MAGYLLQNFHHQEEKNSSFVAKEWMQTPEQHEPRLVGKSVIVGGAK